MQVVHHIRCSAHISDASIIYVADDQLWCNWLASFFKQKPVLRPYKRNPGFNNSRVSWRPIPSKYGSPPKISHPNNLDLVELHLVDPGVTKGFSQQTVVS